MIDLQLEEKTAIVTGASRGLGRATAVALHEQGARVLAVAALAQVALDHFGGLDIVVNNAGIAPAGNFLEQDPQIWNRVMAVNVNAPAILACYLASPKSNFVTGSVYVIDGGESSKL